LFIDGTGFSVPHLLAAFEDRTPAILYDEWKAAQDATLGLMIHLSHENMNRHVSKLNPATKSIVQAQLAKVRLNYLLNQLLLLLLLLLLK
jgi:hypothetical protein